MHSQGDQLTGTFYKVINDRQHSVSSGAFFWLLFSAGQLCYNNTAVIVVQYKPLISASERAFDYLPNCKFPPLCCRNIW